jgi:Tfp pilus assembly protein PilX
MKLRKILKNNRGMTTFVALMMMIMLILIGVAAIKTSNDELTIAGNEKDEMLSFYAAEAGLEFAAAAIQLSYETTNLAPANLPAGSKNLSDAATVAFVTTDDGPTKAQRLIYGSLAGLNALVKSFTIESIGTSLIDAGQVTLKQGFEHALVPIFQFAVFYENDLEIAPGPDMNLTGRVHTNSDLWLQAGSNLYIDSYITCAKDILHGRKGPGGVTGGDIFIKDAIGDYQNMKNADGTFLQSTSTDWYDSASARWDGKVRDDAFGQNELNLPLSNTDDPHKLIERESGNADSYEHKADLRIIDGVVETRVGASWVDVTALMPVGTITSTTFTDQREGQIVNSTDIDMSILKTSSYYPDGGVVYISDQRPGFNAARLTSGADLGKPISIYSENPVYVQGDFNTINKQPAAIAGDAVTFLSNSWSDSTSSSLVIDRIAQETTINASILAGNTNTTSGNYNGGLENLPRFLETWDGVNFNFSGSMISLWNSQQANSPWSYGSYYTAPNRIWAYDADLDDPAKLPPETPMVKVFQKTGWRQKEVGYAINPDADQQNQLIYDF